MMALRIMLLAVCSASIGLNLLFCGAMIRGKAAGKKAGRHYATRKALAVRKKQNRLAVKGTWKDITFKALDKELTA